MNEENIFAGPHNIRLVSTVGPYSILHGWTDGVYFMGPYPFQEAVLLEHLTGEGWKIQRLEDKTVYLDFIEAS